MNESPKRCLNNQQLEELVNALGGMVWEFDWSTGCFTYVSEHAERMLGFARTEWLEPGFWQNHIHPEDAEEAAAYCLASTKDGVDHQFEYRMIASDERVVWVRDIVSVDKTRREKGMLRGILLDITVEKQTQEHATWVENRLAELISHSGLLALAVDATGRITYANEAVEKMMGVGSGDLVGLLARSALSERDQRWADSLTSADLTKLNSEITVQVHDGSGRLRTLVGQAVGASPKDPHGAFVVAQDITDREELSARFAQQANEFDALFRLLEDIYFRVSSDGTILDYKSTSERSLYAPPEAFLGRSLCDVLPPTVSARIMDKIALSLASGSVTTIYYQLEMHGETSDWEARFVPVADDEVSLICRDVTAQLRRERALAESESRYRALVELSPYAIYLVGRDERISYANQAAAELLGANSVSSLVGTSVAELVAPGEQAWDDLEAQREILDRLAHYADSGELPVPTSARIRIRRQDGSLVDVDRKLAGVFVGGEPTLLVMSHDISQGIRSERIVRESRDFFVNLVETLDAGVIITTREARVVMTNRTAQELFGLTSEEFETLDMRAMHVSDHAYEQFLTEALPLVDAGGLFRAEILLQRADGTPFDAELSMRRLDETGKRLVMIRDISERKRTERRLLESEDSFRSLVSESPFGMHVYRLEGERLILQKANAAAEALTGQSADKLVGMSLTDAFPALSGTQIEQAYQRIAREGGTFHTDLFEYDDASIKGAFEVTAFSTAPGFVAVAFADVTARQQADERERRYKDRLRALTAELTSAEDRERRRLAEELHDRVSQNLAAARIRLRQAETFGVGEGLDDVSKATRLIEGAIEETRAITTELFPPVLYELGLSAAVHWLCDEFERVHEITCIRSIEDLQCDNDEARAVMFRAARELLTNVAKHSRSRSARISLDADEGWICLRVVDAGIGFDPERVAGATSDSGFGLFSIRERLPHVGGMIDIHSAPGKGTMVRVILPCPTAGSQVTLPHAHTHKKDDPMTRFHWDTSLETGDAQLDDEHRRLFVLCGRFADAIDSGDAQAAVEYTLFEMLRYATNHFQHEERQMADSHYPDTARHAAEHAAFKRRAEEFAHQYVSGDKVSVEDLYAYLKEWLVIHVTEEDRRLIEHVRLHGRNVE